MDVIKNILTCVPVTYMKLRKTQKKLSFQRKSQNLLAQFKPEGKMDNKATKTKMDVYPPILLPAVYVGPKAANQFKETLAQIGASSKKLA